MNFFGKIKLWYIILVIGILSVLIYGKMSLVLYNTNKRIDSLEQKINSVVSLQMYESIEKWSDSFEIPKYVAYNIAYKETGYKGPFHWNYNPVQHSFAGAKGAMQIIPRYAHYFAGKKVTENELLYNIDFNVQISMKMLKYWHNIHHDWTLVAGAYNSGKPIKNEYALYVGSVKNYKDKWIKL